MKKYLLLLIIALFSFSCSGQDNNSKNTEANKNEKQVKKPKGVWSVVKEFDEQGNLIKYDSVYSWSSHNAYNNLSSVKSDSLIQSFKSRFFRDFSGFENQGFEDIFSQDSLFSKQFFNDDFFGSSFGKDFMDIDKMRQYMDARQRKFLEKYQSEFNNQKSKN